MWEKMGRELKKGTRAVIQGCEPGSEGGRERREVGKKHPRSPCSQREVQ